MKNLAHMRHGYVAMDDSVIEQPTFDSSWGMNIFVFIQLFLIFTKFNQCIYQTIPYLHKAFIKSQIPIISQLHQAMVNLQRDRLIEN